MAPPKPAAGSKFKAASTASTTAKPAAAAPVKGESSFATAHPHLFDAVQQHRGIGQGLPKQINLSRYVRWPRYIRLQRQKAILQQRIKVPPAIAQFTRTLDKNAAATLFRLLAHYRPETKIEKRARLLKQAESETKGEKATAANKGDKPLFIKYGLNHITDLIESKRAKLVVIAHDIDPIELVVWLPALCRKMNVPYCIVKGKARLGHLVYKKTVTAVALTDVRPDDKAKLEQITTSVRQQYNDDATNRRKFGGGILGYKSKAKLKIRQRIAATATAQRNN